MSEQGSSLSESTVPDAAAADGGATDGGAAVAEATDYRLLCAQLRSLAEESACYLPMLANASALLFDGLDRLNWAGFYLRREDDLLLGPFQGHVACVRIARGRGVCGTALATGETQRVADVHAFPGHIACDAASRSEIVVPVRWHGEVIGVLDIDSPEPARFSPADQEGLEAFVATLEDACDFSGWNV